MGAYLLGIGLLVFTIKRLINYRAGTSRYEMAIVLPPAIFGILFLFYGFIQPKIYAYSLTWGIHRLEIWLLLAGGIAIFTGLVLIPLIKIIRKKKSPGTIDMD